MLLEYAGKYVKIWIQMLQQILFNGKTAECKVFKKKCCNFWFSTQLCKLDWPPNNILCGIERADLIHNLKVSWPNRWPRVEGILAETAAVTSKWCSFPSNQCEAQVDQPGAGPDVAYFSVYSLSGFFQSYIYWHVPILSTGRHSLLGYERKKVTALPSVLFPQDPIMICWKPGIWRIGLNEVSFCNTLPFCGWCWSQPTIKQRSFNKKETNGAVDESRHSFDSDSTLYLSPEQVWTVSTPSCDNSDISFQ